MNISHVLMDEARKHLSDTPYDAAHDLAHHLEVMSRALDLSHNVEESVDEEALRIAVMWHDVPAGQPGEKASTDTAQFLEKRMNELGFQKEMIDKVVHAVGNHSFDQQPTTIEGKILYDADKLELLNINRFKRYHTAIERGDVTTEKAKKDFAWVAESYKTLRSKLHFERSRQLFDKLYPQLKENSAVRATFQRYGVTL